MYRNRFSSRCWGEQRWEQIYLLPGTADRQLQPKSTEHTLQPRIKAHHTPSLRETERGYAGKHGSRVNSKHNNPLLCPYGTHYFFWPVSNKTWTMQDLQDQKKWPHTHHGLYRTLIQKDSRRTVCEATDGEGGGVAFLRDHRAVLVCARARAVAAFFSCASCCYEASQRNFGV